MKDAGGGTRRAPIVYGRNLSFGVPKTTMQICVKLFATLGRYALNGVAGSPFDMEFSEGATLDNVVDRLNLPRDEVKVFFVNGRARPKDWILKPGDEVGIFPLVAGG